MTWNWRIFRHQRKIWLIAYAFTKLYKNQLFMRLISHHNKPESGHKYLPVLGKTVYIIQLLSLCHEIWKQSRKGTCHLTFSEWLNKVNLIQKYERVISDKTGLWLPSFRSSFLGCASQTLINPLMFLELVMFVPEATLQSLGFGSFSIDSPHLLVFHLLLALILISFSVKLSKYLYICVCMCISLQYIPYYILYYICISFSFPFLIFSILSLQFLFHFEVSSHFIISIVHFWILLFQLLTSGGQYGVCTCVSSIFYL